MNPKNGRIVRRLRAKRGEEWPRRGCLIAKGLQSYRCRTGGVIGEKRSVVAAQKGCIFRLFCCDNLIKWNIKCVIFRAKKEAKKTEERFNIVEFSIKGMLMFVNENERNRVTNKLINSKIKLKTNTIYNVIGVFFDNFAL